MSATCRTKCQHIAATKIKTAGQWIAIKQDINAVQWAHPTETAAPPSLAFRPWKFCQNRGDNIAKQRFCIGTSHMITGKEKPALWRVLFAQRLTRYPDRCHKSGNCRFWRVNTRAAFFNHTIGLGYRNSPRINRQMARPTQPIYAGLICPYTQIIKRGLYGTGEMLRRHGLHSCRDFLANKFNQQISHAIPPHLPQSRLHNTHVPAPAPARYKRRVR